MLNSLGEFQSILVLGGKSDLAISILEGMPLSDSAEIHLLGRNILSLNLEDKFKGAKINLVEIDFKDVEEVEAKIKSIFTGSDIDLVIFAYSILGSEKLQLNKELFSEVLFNNFYTQALALNLVNTEMCKQLHGQILLISSVAGMRPRKRNFVYGTSKFGVDLIAQGLQKHNVGKNVFLTILRPGFVKTRMTEGMPPAPFATDRNSVAKIAVEALKKHKRIVYTPKYLLIVMFILKLLPEKIFRLIDR